MRRQSLQFKVGLYLTIALTAAMVVFTLAVVRHQRDELLNAAASHVIQLSEVIIRSTRFAMLQTQPAYVDRIPQRSEVVVITGAPFVAHAKEAIRLGAYDCLAKPVPPDAVRMAVARAANQKKWALRRISWRDSAQFSH